MSRQKYPLGIIAVYGPDVSRATKLVASVVKSRDRTDPEELRVWTMQEGDVRNDDAIASEVAAWLQQHRVKQTLRHDRILGCPHEEGIDYPMGRACPSCPFWHGIDRFTHKPVVTPPPTMSADDVVAELSVVRPVQPKEALASADAHRAELVDTLLYTLERGVTGWRDLPPEQALLFSYALYLLAKWREARAYPVVIRWLLLPDNGAFAVAGDVVTMDGGRILAAVYDGDWEPIKRLILDRHADEFCRAVAVSALAFLAVWAEAPRQVIVDRLLWLAREGLEREPSHVWGALAVESADIEALELFPELRRAYDEGLIDPRTIGRSELDDVEASPRGRLLEEMRDRHPPIDDVVEATRWWSDFQRSTRAEQLAQLAAEDQDVIPDRIDRVEPYRAPEKVGRNDPCPCGSGKKYKKCCGA